MYAILVKAVDSADEVLLPQKDEYPGSSPWFTEMSAALEVASQVIGRGVSEDGDENKIASARVVRLSPLEAPDAKSSEDVLARYHLVADHLDEMDEMDDEYEEFDAMLVALGWVLGLNKDKPDDNIWKS